MKSALPPPLPVASSEADLSVPRDRALPRRGWARPAPRWAWLVLPWSALGLAASAGWLQAQAWQAATIGVLLIALIDLARLLRAPTPQAARKMHDTWAIGVERPVTLIVEASQRRQRVDAFDLHPGGWAMRDLPRRLDLRRGEAAIFDYQLRANMRGDFQFDGVQLRMHSPWGLWWQSRVTGEIQRVRVFPNFAPLAKFAMFSAEQASRLVGAHVKRRRGEGTDFHQMREYRVGDSLRQIDWKATARARRLISREYQDERNQQLVLMLDTGRRLMARDGALSHFDHVLDAALVVAYLALRQGDGVGLLANGGQSRWVPPQRGVGAIDNLLRASYALQPQPIATDFLAAATELSLRQRRRSLVMLVTNLRDEDMDDLLAAVRMLRGRHLVCVASLREGSLDQALDEDVDDLSGAIRAGATAQYLEHRVRAHEALRNHGVMVLDVSCSQLAASLVEKYLAIKRDGLL
ncbi:MULTISPECIES: DUF58 domain-containing protein [unclassified Lysobacter]|uniref:DUF58 domain-containing protein n=1 Tax=unclassified Lysobacter TaxID=2635362 RepID=UPI001BEC19B1|nr:MULTISPECIES: DUF58 domain-containing protein [unclassified Lysobacter]MBT2749005.1 DUF58 domain-containing protein [Lysobacter sp. ISL-42]MBT2750338.1 DUF58 domain-containing protein [Lysobacter sp. ISL-50]MBT2778436.1 DUF58 domain-containing protein [Lysobacter sp. ISL-54]MBT2781052.1 DUF58 domain-containing protein [Lysobacter sp. ISL-52]